MKFWPNVKKQTYQAYHFDTDLTFQINVDPYKILKTMNV